MQFVIRVLINAIALWAVSELFTGVDIYPQGRGAANDIVVLLAVSLIFSLVNAIIKPIIKALTFPLFILTLGLITLVVNAAMLGLTSWLTTYLDFGIHISGFWTAVGAALVISVISFILSLVFRSGKGK